MHVTNHAELYEYVAHHVLKDPERFELNDSATIVIVTYNSAGTIVACLDSVKKTLRGKDEVIIVDNASADHTLSLVRDLIPESPQLKLIPNKSNRGYAAAANQGARAGKNPVIAFLNPDTIVTPNWLQRLAFHLQPDGVAATGPLSNGAAGLQKVTSYLPEEIANTTDINEIISMLWKSYPHRSKFANLLIGFCLMIKRSIYDSVGGLDETLFLGNDDLDLCWRLRLAGYELAVAMDTIIFHKGQESFKSSPESTTAGLVQESTDYLFYKLHRHYGAGKVPSSQELWDMDWFQPSCRFIENHALTSIIILTCDQLEFTRLCIDSIFKYTNSPFELIVIDNGSKDGSIDYLSHLTRSNSACLRIKLIVNQDNMGFAKGCNQGLAASRGEYLLLLNNDVVVTPQWLPTLVKAFESDDRRGIVGPMTNYASGPQLLVDPGYDVNTLAGLDEFAISWSKKNRDQIESCSRVVGFCMLIKRAVVDKIGGLDGRYGLGNFEDDDFCIRARLAGYTGGIVKDCFVHHFGGRTFWGNNLNYEERLKNNWELFKQKWEIPSHAPLGRTYELSLPSKGFDQSEHYIALDSDDPPDAEKYDLPLDQGASKVGLADQGSLSLKNYCLSVNGNNQFKLLDKLTKDNADPPYMAILEDVAVIGPLLLHHSGNGGMKAVNIEEDKVSKDFGGAASGRTCDHVFSQCGARKTGSYLMLWGLRTDNFWHWMMEALAKVVMAHACGFNGYYIVPPKYSQSGFIRESLELIGIHPDRLCVYDGQPWRVERLFLPQHIDGNHQLCKYPFIIDHLRSMLMKSLTPTRHSYDRIYIARGNPNLTRRILNETQLLEILFKFGFQRVLMENHSLKDQIAISAGAKFLVAPHGAGAVHCLFMPAESTVVELFPTTYINPCMLPVIDRLRHRYFMIPSSHLKVSESDDYEASLFSLEVTLKRELSQTKTNQRTY